MKIIAAEELIHELTEDELARLFKVPPDFKLTDAKLVERSRDASGRLRQVIGIRFRRHVRRTERHLEHQSDVKTEKS